MIKFQFDPDGLEIVNKLQHKGFEAYFVGGCIRDILMGRKPKDFDIATNAKPRDIKRLIPYCFIIGRRFQLVLARRGPKQFEIATFRKETPLVNHYQWVDENLFGTPQDDATRRDFTLNALFYDPNKKKLLDFVEGAKDIKNKTIRVIGHPVLRFQEDPIRILRAIRFAARLNFKLAEETREGIEHCAHHLGLAVPDRLREELLRMFREGASLHAWKLMNTTKVIHAFLPAWGTLDQYTLPALTDETTKNSPKTTKTHFLQTLFNLKKSPGAVRADKVLEHLLSCIDKEIAQGKTLPAPLTLATFFLPVARLTCFAHSQTWKTPDMSQLVEMKFFNELHQSLRLSNQENIHIRQLLCQRDLILKHPPHAHEVDSKQSHLRTPGFEHLLKLCQWEAEAHRHAGMMKNCQLWATAYAKLLGTGYTPRPWEALGPYDRQDKGRGRSRRRGRGRDRGRPGARTQPHHSSPDTQEFTKLESLAADGEHDEDIVNLDIEGGERSSFSTTKSASFSGEEFSESSNGYSTNNSQFDGQAQSKSNLHRKKRRRRRRRRRGGPGPDHTHGAGSGHSPSSSSRASDANDSGVSASPASRSTNKNDQE